MANPDCYKCGNTQSFINGHDGAIECRNKLCIEARKLKDQVAALAEKETERMDQVVLTLGWRERAEAAEREAQALREEADKKHVEHREHLQVENEKYHAQSRLRYAAEQTIAAQAQEIKELREELKSFKEKNNG